MKRIDMLVKEHLEKNGCESIPPFVWVKIEDAVRAEIERATASIVARHTSPRALARAFAAGVRELGRQKADIKAAHGMGGEGQLQGVTGMPSIPVQATTEGGQPTAEGQAA